MRLLRPLAACAAAALILTLASCADAPPDSDEIADTPLTPYWEALYGGEGDMEQMQKEQDELQVKIEEKVAECMTEQGFEYTAVDPASWEDIEMSGSDDDVWDPDDKKWVAKWGYGITDWPGRDDEGESQGAEEEAPDDPNSTYYESLTDGEKAAYDEALSGPMLSDEEYADPNYEYKWEDGGCYGKASHEVESDGEEDELTKYEDLITRMNEVWEDVQSDSRVATLEAEWSSCMSDAGESGFEAQFEAQDSISSDYAKLNPTQGDPGPEGENAEEIDTSPETNGEIGALKEREIELALADLECRENTSYYDEYEKISVAVEQEFVDANKAELDAMKLALEQAR